MTLSPPERKFTVTAPSLNPAAAAPALMEPWFDAAEPAPVKSKDVAA